MFVLLALTAALIATSIGYTVASWWKKDSFHMLLGLAALVVAAVPACIYGALSS